MPGISEFSIPMTAQGRSFALPPGVAPSQEQMQQFLQSPAGGSASPDLAGRIATNVAAHPQGNPYVKMFQDAQAKQHSGEHPMKQQARSYVDDLLAQMKGVTSGG